MSWLIYPGEGGQRRKRSVSTSSDTTTEQLVESVLEEAIERLSATGFNAKSILTVVDPNDIIYFMAFSEDDNEYLEAAEVYLPVGDAVYKPIPSEVAYELADIYSQYMVTLSEAYQSIDEEN